MAKPKKPNKSGAKSSENDRSYEVGRGRPPKHTQFKAGDKRHRPGRPPGSKNVRTLMMEAAGQQVFATIGGERRKISKLYATILQQASKAAAGDPKAGVQFIKWIQEIEQNAVASKPSDYPLSDADLEVIKAVHDRLWQYAKGDE